MRVVATHPPERGRGTALVVLSHYVRSPDGRVRPANRAASRVATGARNRVGSAREKKSRADVGTHPLATGTGIRRGSTFSPRIAGAPGTDPRSDLNPAPPGGSPRAQERS